jgi:hypothetical protein
MSLVAAKRCVRHEMREAVGRCASCAGHFCRECVSEHTGLLYCAHCLAREVAKISAAPKARWRAAEQWVFTAAAVLLLWVVFYGFGQFLKVIPPKVHEGSVWRAEDS